MVTARSTCLTCGGEVVYLVTTNSGLWHHEEGRVGHHPEPDREAMVDIKPTRNTPREGATA